MKLIIEDDEGRRTIVPFLGDALDIGRADDNHVRLGEKNVSRRHGRIVRDSGRFVVEDLSSFTGIRVNGEKVKGKRQVKEGDLIQISEFDLQLQAGPDDLPKRDAEPPPLADEDEDDEPTAVSGEGAKSAQRHEETAVIKREDLMPALKAPEAVEVPLAERPRLVGANGALRGTEFPLARSPVSLGRALENDVCLDHPQVSRSHCRLALVGGGWKVIDAESRHGVKVNGEPYAASPLHHGDVLEVGPVRLVFALPGRPVSLPAEVASAPAAEVPAAVPPIATTSGPEEVAAPHKGFGASKVALGAGAVVIAVAAAVLLLGPRSHAPQAEALDVADASLQRAGTSAAAHRYGDAVRSVQAAIAAGAAPEQTRVLPSLETEARAEVQYEQLVQAIARGDFDTARSLLDLLATVPTWYGGRALEHSQEVKAGYVKLHLERASAARGHDAAACLTEANLALAVNPQSEPARSLASDCSGSGAPPSRPARTASAATVARAERTAAAAPIASAARQSSPARASAESTAAPAVTSAADEAEARRLLRQGNVEATSGEYPAALADFERALRYKPSNAVLGSLYRSLGATNSRAGNAELGAHYYRLYLPYCDNPTEKTFLQKTLDDYDASRGRKP